MFFCAFILVSSLHFQKPIEVLQYDIYNLYKNYYCITYCSASAKAIYFYYLFIF